MNYKIEDKIGFITMDVAIEFAKFLMQKEVVRNFGRNFSGEMTVISEVPREYQLMYGDLIQNGDRLFSEFAINKLINRYE